MGFFVNVARFLAVVIVNIFVLATIGIILRLTGVDKMVGEFGMLVIMSFVFGMMGAYISLLMSRWMAKRLYRVKLVTSKDPVYGAMVLKIYELSKRAGLPKNPEVGVYPSKDVNAFATGASKSKSLVAVSQGLLAKMDDDALEGVLAHEISHIANGDMVSMTLLQGIINTFVILIANLLTNIVVNLLSKDDDGGGIGWIAEIAIYFVISTVVSMLAMPIVFAFSRYREYRADQGGAKLAGKKKMISALQTLMTVNMKPIAGESKTVAYLKISTGTKRKGTIGRLFSSHPPLEERIKRLERNTRLS